MSSKYSEDALIEQPAIELLKSLGWEHINAFDEFGSHASPLGRQNKAEVILTKYLIPALRSLNPNLPESFLSQALERLIQDRSIMSLANANKDVYHLLKNGIRIKIPSADGNGETTEIAKLIDWNNPDNNSYLLVSQFWITGEMYTRRADLVCFINGIPVILFELKASHKNIINAFNQNIRDYKSTVSQLFWFNAFIIASNGSESKIGSTTANWEHYADWKKINSEGEKGVISLDTIIRGTCEPKRLLDLIQNFILFMDSRGGTIKIIAKNHQYLGVNNAIQALQDMENKDGKLGVFWHTQGSGKSISMILFAEKVFRTIPGNWTFVIITDRLELDSQIYDNFVDAGALSETNARAESSSHLRQLLRENHRYVFTLIHKFRTEGIEEHPVLSERSDIIVITDEAHRSQYDSLAFNMRKALPNASFLAFTGTPLIIGEERTRQVFGDYVSVYNFRQSIEDKATVPLYYENRIPELQLSNDDLDDEMNKLLEESELNEPQEKKLEREFARQYHLITRNDRIVTIAKDIVKHFTSRGYLGKGMFVAIDKATAVRMYDKVKYYWNKELERLRKETKKQEYPDPDTTALIKYMEETDMAVVVSQSLNEAEEMAKKNLDILPHRRRMVYEKMDEKFKNPDDPLRLVFVCAMWITGFDAPSCSTIYLDKPMKNHTLMQTIARANRVFKEKQNGLIVDYVGVFRDLKNALAIYASDDAESELGGNMPVAEKDNLIQALREAISGGETFLKNLDIDINPMLTAEPFEFISLRDDAVEAVLVDDITKRAYLSISSKIWNLFKAIMPDPLEKDLRQIAQVHHLINARILSLQEPPDISSVTGKIESLLDDSIETTGYIIREPNLPFNSKYIDLSKIDFDKLAEKLKRGRKRMQIEKLKNLLKVKLDEMIAENRTRMDYYKKFNELINEYNSETKNIDELFEDLKAFTQSLMEEDKRALSEEMSEEELAIFDLLTKPAIELTDKEIKQIKAGTRNLLEKLKREKLVLDWRKKQSTIADVRVTIEKVLDETLPEKYSQELYYNKASVIFQHIYDSYYGAGKSLYAA